MFQNKQGNSEVLKLRQKIGTLQKKLKEKTEFVIAQKLKTKDQTRLKNIYQNAAILRHKMLKRMHRRKSKRRAAAQQAFELEQVDRMSAIVAHRHELYD